MITRKERKAYIKRAKSVEADGREGQRKVRVSDAEDEPGLAYMTYGIGSSFELAATYRLKAGDPKRAIRDLEIAAKEYKISSDWAGADHNFQYQKEDLESSERVQRRADDLKRGRDKPKGLAGRVAAGIFTILGLFLLSPNITGNVIGNSPVVSANIVGAILFFIGIIGLFFTFKRNK